MSHHYARHYARFHPDTPAHDAYMRALLSRWIGAHLPEDRSAAILDVGCGRGYALGLLRATGFTRAAGIDPDPGQVEFARGRGLGASVEPDTPAFLRAHPSQYDLVLLMDVLEHVPTPQQVPLLEAIRQALKPGGRIICTVPNALSPLGHYWRHIDYTHELCFTVPSLEYALHAGGFTTIAISPLEFFTRPRFFWIPLGAGRQWWRLVITRWWWRAVHRAELGPPQARELLLSPNLLAVARRD